MSLTKLLIIFIFHIHIYTCNKQKSKEMYFTNTDYKFIDFRRNRRNRSKKNRFIICMGSRKKDRYGWLVIVEPKSQLLCFN